MSHYFDLLVLAVYALLEFCIGKKRPLGAGSILELILLIVGSLGLALLWVLFPRRK